jgi:hypothetical protein
MKLLQVEIDFAKKKINEYLALENDTQQEEGAGLCWFLSDSKNNKVSYTMIYKWCQSLVNSSIEWHHKNLSLWVGEPILGPLGLVTQHRKNFCTEVLLPALDNPVDF